ncbi:MAG TPA: D-alanyl-D-alanine carboxypeptidase family protein [Pyrinomonadaceae bacterium]|nr:D-alanyl-D-alanine carboxypeptidase family protein [Pyrinomonadaceae bacterium]
MKNRKVHLLVIIAALAVVVGFVSLGARGSGGQAPAPAKKSQSPVKATALTKETKAKISSTTSAAATRNLTLRDELNWTFGGKQQRGWYLYDSLLAVTLNSDDAPIGDEFAEAIEKWQKRRGLSASGVLDETSWMAMVSHWQGNRLKNRATATPDQLVLAPSSDFYDPSRADELRQVERKTYEAYKRMIAAAIADPELNLAQISAGELAPKEKFFKIISAYRSREYQEMLRRKSPNAGSAGLAVNNSPHFTGRALDIYVGGDPVDTKDANRAIQVNTPAYRWLVRNAERFGFRPYFYEPWHWEYVK